MSQIIDLGKIRFTYTGAYSGSTTYELNDVVSYGGHLYHYSYATSTSNVLPSNTTYWSKILSGFNFRGTFSTTTQYYPGDVVNYGGDIFIALVEALGPRPITSGSWNRLSSGLRFTGEYNALTEYRYNDLVLYGGALYRNILLSTGNAPVDTTYWEVLVQINLPSQTSNNGKLLTTNGSDLSWTGTPTLVSITTTGDVTVGDDLYVGSGAAAFETTATLTSAAAVVKTASGASSFGQIAFTNATSTSSTDIIVYMNNGNDSNGWMGMGITGSGFDDTTYGITGPGDGYIFHDTLNSTFTGNMVFATGASGSANKIIFAAGGYDSGSTQMEITPNVNVHIEIPTPSTSSTTGALTVVGGVGIQGDMNIAGQVNIVGNLSFGGGSTTTANLAVSDPIVFVGNSNNSDSLDLGLIGEYAISVSAITATVNNKALTSNVATLTTASPHTYRVGDWVVVTGVDATFNGTFQILAVPTTTTFTYAKTAANVASAAVSPTGSASVSLRRLFSGAVRDASDGVFKFFKDAVVKPSTTVDFTQAGIAYAAIQTGGITAGGNVGITGTLDTSGNFGVNVDKFTVAGSTGNTLIAGTLGVTSNIAVNTDKFTVAASSGNTVVAGTLGVTGLATFTGGALITGTTDVQELREQLVDVTISSNVATCNWTAGNIFYIATAPTAAFTVALTNVPTDVSKTLTVNVVVTQGSTGYIPNVLNINGAAQTIKWSGSSAPTATNGAGKLDIFSFTLIRTTGGAWIAFGTSNLNFG